MTRTLGKADKAGSTLITGASSGIGRELARVFARHGHDVVLTSRNKHRLDQLADELRQERGVVAEVIAQDLSLPAAAEEVRQKLQEESIAIDILVNNAGFDVYGEFHETDIDRELQMIQLNVATLTQLTKLLLGGMRERGHGRVLNVGSTGSYVPTPLNAVYSATKAYVLSFSRALAVELRGSGVTVTALCPGATRTEFQKRAGIGEIALLRFGAMDPDAVARAAYRGLMAGRRVVVPGLFNKIQVLATRLLPTEVLVRAAGAMLQPD